MAEPRRHSGFTLIEVLLALAITMLILTGAFVTFSSLITGLEVLRRSSGQTHGINRFWNLVSRDIRQFANRPVRNQFGETEPALFGGALADDALNFTRVGWHNPQHHARSNLQRVRYVLEDESVWRESYRVLDRTDVSEPQRVELLKNVEVFEMAFFDKTQVIRAGEFSTDKWPLNWGVNVQEVGIVDPPYAVEIRLEISGMGEIRRLYEIPGA